MSQFHQTKQRKILLLGFVCVIVKASNMFHQLISQLYCLVPPQAKAPQEQLPFFLNIQFFQHPNNPRKLEITLVDVQKQSLFVGVSMENEGQNSCGTVEWQPLEAKVLPNPERQRTRGVCHFQPNDKEVPWDQGWKLVVG
eukprot:Lithocolla_globosa_v1_NODE_848_length_3191_cov_22.651786.p3 type:complete len:140 gc:universal NODE_848_length_3191_cov_22.651786:1396-1815(+)